MTVSRIKLIIHPSGGDGNNVAASDFLKQVSALRDLVLLSVHSAEAVETKIVGLSTNSPANVELEAVWTADERPLDVMGHFNAVRAVIDSGLAPKDLRRPALDALKEFVSVIGRGVREATLQIGEVVIKVEQQARSRVEGVFEPDYTAEGTIDGMLEAVNIHGNRNQFVLYPVVGPTRINCFFPDEMLVQVKPTLGKYAIVSGLMKYRWREKFPFEARANHIEAVEEGDQPSFEEILGIAPNATGGALSEDFVRELRSGWN
jgi:hypothetical protein